MTHETYPSSIVVLLFLFLSRDRWARTLNSFSTIGSCILFQFESEFLVFWRPIIVEQLYGVKSSQLSSFFLHHHGRTSLDLLLFSELPWAFYQHWFVLFYTIFRHAFTYTTRFNLETWPWLVLFPPTVYSSTVQTNVSRSGDSFFICSCTLGE